MVCLCWCRVVVAVLGVIEAACVHQIPQSAHGDVKIRDGALEYLLVDIQLPPPPPPPPDTSHQGNTKPPTTRPRATRAQG
jgi:hypothetical protein